MTRSVSFFIFAAILAVPSRIHAQGFGVAPHIGTLGIGVDGAIALTQSLNIRGGVNFVPFSLDIEASEVNFNFDFATPQFLVTLDLHPGGSIFRLSVGALAAASDFTLQGDLREPIEIGDATYTPAQIGTLSGTVLTNSISPYVGIGLGNVAHSGIGFFLDLGVAFHGTPAFTLEADGPLSGNPAFQTDLEIERRDIQDELEPYKVYPVLALGLKVGF